MRPKQLRREKNRTSRSPIAPGNATDVKSENTCRRRECREWEREGLRCSVDQRGGRGDTEKGQNVWKGQPEDESGQLQSLAGIRPSRICPSSEGSQRAMGPRQSTNIHSNSSSALRTRKSWRSSRTTRLTMQSVPEQELKPSTTSDRRRSPATGASTLPTPVREVGTKARSGVGSSEKLEKTSSDTLKTTVANNDLVRSPRRGERLVTAPPPSSTKHAKQNTKLQHEDHQSGCGPSEKNLRVPIRKLHQEASGDNMGTETEKSSKPQT